MDKLDVERARKTIINFRNNRDKLSIYPDTLICNLFIVYLRDNHPDLFLKLIKRFGLKKKDFKIVSYPKKGG